jgi:hypothetical protein
MRKTLSILIVTILIFSLTACTFQDKQEIEESDSEFVEYGVAGNIVELEIGNDFESNRILVKGNSDNGATYTEGWVTITKDTKIYKNEIVTIDDLELNMYVNVFFDGPVAESFPVQGTAKQINIIE